MTPRLHLQPGPKGAGQLKAPWGATVNLWRIPYGRIRGSALEERIVPLPE